MTRQELVRDTKERLKKAGITAAGFETAELVCHVMGIGKAQLAADSGAAVTEQQRVLIQQLLDRRERGYPLQYLLGEWEFYGRTFAVGEGVLIPRPDTETLCSEVIQALREKPLTVLDLCSGSGCIAVTIAKECPNSYVYAVEKSPAAFSYLQQNIAENAAQVQALCLDALEEAALDTVPDCDIIVSNPPYLTQEDMARLQKEVSFEPDMALYGDRDGLAFYRALTERWKAKLRPGGRLFYEIGQGQEQEVRHILSENGFDSICETPDLCGIIRVISGALV